MNEKRNQEILDIILNARQFAGFPSLLHWTKLIKDRETANTDGNGGPSLTWLDCFEDKEMWLEASSR